MKIKKNLLFAAMLSVGIGSAFGWGQKGHDTVAFIAQNHLTPATAAAIDSLLDGSSIVYWANWLDNASHSPEYAYSKTWHYKNIDAGQTFESAPNIPEGNIVDALYEQIGILQDPSATKSEKALALKMTVHFIGDIHQPMHMGRATDRGGNSHKVNFFDKETNLHSIWDSNVLETGHKWSHTEWQREIDRLTPDQQLLLVKDGNPSTWGKETYEICLDIYNSTPENTKVEYDYVFKWTPTIEMQLEKGGLRLADVLNSVFDADYIPQNSFIRK